MCGADRAGRAFCTGANLQGRNNQSKKTKAGVTLETGFHPFLRRIRNLHCPLVTAVNGPAAGAGMSFALLGDMICARGPLIFFKRFVRIGLVPDCGSTWLLPRLIGRARSVELSLMGERLPAEKALEWGLVNRVYDDGVLMEEAMKLARDLASGPTVALSLIRKLYWDSPKIRSRISSISNSSASCVPATRTISVKALARSWRSARRSSKANDRGRALPQRRALVRRGDRRHRRGKTVRRRQPGNLALRYRASGWHRSARSCAARRRVLPRRHRARPASPLSGLMQLAFDAGVPSPRVLHVLTPEDDLGTGFIMQQVEGETIARKILRDDEFAAARPFLARQLGGVLAGLHRLPLSKLPELRHMTAAKELVELERDYRSLDWPKPVFELALRWLRDRDPGPSAEVTLVHGDFRNGNSSSAPTASAPCSTGSSPISAIPWRISAGSASIPGVLARSTSRSAVLAHARSCSPAMRPRAAKSIRRASNSGK
jgi:enoyl-CoA hydratase/carnithine racemase